MSALSEEMGKDWCAVLLSFYVFTGEDCTSAFKGKCKVAPLKKFMKTPRFMPRSGIFSLLFCLEHEV